MNNSESFSKYISIGMIIGSFLGVIFSIAMRNNTFFSISGTGFGLLFGMLISIMIWGLKK